MRGCLLAVLFLALAAPGLAQDPDVPPTESAPRAEPTQASPVPMDWAGRYYPLRAQEMEIEGLVALDCMVEADHSLNCTVTSEEPSGFGFGFGEAALAVSRHFRMAPMTVDGAPTAGGRYPLRIPFRLADN